jgi:hypothetical protein
MRSSALLAGAAALGLNSLAAADPPPPPAAPPPYAPPYGAPYPYPGPWMAPPPPGYAPWWAMPYGPPPERRSKGMMITGITLFGLGATATTAGIAMIVAASMARCVVEDSVAGSAGGAAHGPAPAPASARGGEHVRSSAAALNGCGSDFGVLGLGFSIAGGITGIIGVPLYVVGARPAPPKSAAPASALLPEVRVGVASGSLRWSF